jgi:fumarate reductase subunit D
MKRRPIVPLLWTLFSAGGTIAAFLLPAHVVLFAIAIPLGWIAPPKHQSALALLSHPLTRFYLFVLCSLPLFHWAHRFKYTLYDGLQVKHLNELIDTFCYGGAAIGSGFAAYLLWSIP